jgi:hypothetical protein
MLITVFPLRTTRRRFRIRLITARTRYSREYGNVWREYFFQNFRLSRSKFAGFEIQNWLVNSFLTILGFQKDGKGRSRVVNFSREQKRVVWNSLSILSDFFKEFKFLEL